MSDGFTDYLPVKAERLGAGEFKIVSKDGDFLFWLDGTAFAEWVCETLNRSATLQVEMDELRIENGQLKSMDEQNFAVNFELFNWLSDRYSEQMKDGDALHHDVMAVVRHLESERDMFKRGYEGRERAKEMWFNKAAERGKRVVELKRELATARKDALEEAKKSLGKLCPRCAHELTECPTCQGAGKSIARRQTGCFGFEEFPIPCIQCGGDGKSRYGRAIEAASRKEGVSG